jgi:carbamoyl-phosphate synthase large subunit
MGNVPCITTVQGLGAAVQGIEAMRAGNLGVRSLQEWGRLAAEAAETAAAEARG